MSMFHKTASVPWTNRRHHIERWVGGRENERREKTTSIPRECLAQHFCPSTMTRSDRCHTNQTRRTDETLSYLDDDDDDEDDEDVFIYLKSYSWNFFSRAQGKAFRDSSLDLFFVALVIFTIGYDGRASSARKVVFLFFLLTTSPPKVLASLLVVGVSLRSCRAETCQEGSFPSRLDELDFVRATRPFLFLFLLSV